MIISQVSLAFKNSSFVGDSKGVVVSKIAWISIDISSPWSSVADQML
jgi:hypothetical protein